MQALEQAPLQAQCTDYCYFYPTTFNLAGLALEAKTDDVPHLVAFRGFGARRWGKLGQGPGTIAELEGQHG